MSKKIDPLSADSVVECNVCASPLDLEAGDITGYFGVSPVGFCVWCLSSLTDMVIKMQGFDVPEYLKERIYELKSEELQEKMSK